MPPRHPRPAALHGPWLAFLGSVALFLALIGLLLWPSGDAGQAQGPIVVFCAAGIKPVVEAVAKEYEQKYGVAVRPDYGGSQALLTRLIESNGEAGSPDLYLPADESYIQIGRQRGLLAENIAARADATGPRRGRGQPEEDRESRRFAEAWHSAGAGQSRCGRNRQGHPRHAEQEGPLGRDRQPRHRLQAHGHRCGQRHPGRQRRCRLRLGHDRGARCRAWRRSICRSSRAFPRASRCRSPRRAGSRRRPCASPATWLPVTGACRSSRRMASRWWTATSGLRQPEIVLYAGAMLRPAVEPTPSRTSSGARGCKSSPSTSAAASSSPT